MKNLLSAIISVIVFSSAGFAVDNSSDNFTIPHDFSSGETISSQKMNENFQAIQELGSHPLKCCFGTTAKRSDLIVYGCRARLAASAGVC